MPGHSLTFPARKPASKYPLIKKFIVEFLSEKKTCSKKELVNAIRAQFICNENYCYRVIRQMVESKVLISPERNSPVTLNVQNQQR